MSIENDSISNNTCKDDDKVIVKKWSDIETANLKEKQSSDITSKNTKSCKEPEKRLAKDEFKDEYDSPEAINVLLIVAASLVLVIACIYFATYKPEEVKSVEAAIDCIDEDWYEDIDEGWYDYEDDITVLIEAREARELYDELSDKNKSKVKNYNLLVSSEKKLAKQVENLINKIGSIKKIGEESEDAIDEAYAAYDNASSVVQNMISNYSHLEKAKDRFDELQEQAWVECSKCNGSGKTKCYLCNGTGHVKYYYGSSDLEAYLDGYDPWEYGPCSSCKETGKSDCHACHGEGGYYNW